MTTLSVVRVPDSSPRPLPWRRMAWVTWRQHRAALTSVSALLGAMTVALWILGSRLHHGYAAATTCHPAGSFTCASAINAFNGMNGFLTNGLVLQVVPPLIGAFVGAPLLARELETGTFRFAWTQGFGRRRWTTAKLVALGALMTVATGALTFLTSWYYQPYFPTAGPASLGKQVPIAASSPFSPGLFGVRGVTFAAWTLAAFAIGALAGALIRRVVPAIVVTLAVYAGLAVSTGTFLREHYLAPLATRALHVPDLSWVISQQWFTRGGQPAGPTALGRMLQKASPALAGKGGVPQSLDTWRYLVRHGYTQVTTYQPAGRFWPFQWIEGGWLLGLSVLLIAAAVWLVRRRAA
jgi:ABC-2 family transporter protein